MRRAHALLTLAVVGILSAPAAFAAKIDVGQDRSLNVGLLLQTQGALNRSTEPTPVYGSDLYIRRIRLLVNGDATKRLSFFLDVDQPNLGKGGDWTPSFYVQDAFLSYALIEKQLFIDAGMMVVPLMRHGMQGAAALTTLDYHASVIRYPTAGKVWRDAGAQVRWYGLDGKLQVRGGAFNGVAGLARPRTTAHARWNFIGTENGFFFTGQSFSDTPKLSVGAGVDWQSQGGVDKQKYLGLAADLYGEFPTSSEQAVVFQLTAMRFDNGVGAESTGMGGFAEAGYRIGWVNPVFSVEYFDSAKAGSDLLALRPGLNFLVDKNAFNVKAEVGVVRKGNLREAPTALNLLLQAQLYF